MNRPRPYRGRCPICPARSRSGYESHELAESWTVYHLLARHHLTIAKINDALTRPVELVQLVGVERSTR